MIRCVECGSHEPEGALFCSECGAALLKMEMGKKRDHLSITDEAAPSLRPRLLGQEIDPVVGVSEVTIVIPSSGRRLRKELKKKIAVGRSDPDMGHFPELDLTEDQGIQHGVSRHHADIENSSEGVVLLDRESRNGTYLNNYRLPPDLPYPLYSGDEVRFGTLLVYIFIE